MIAAATYEPRVSVLMLVYNHAAFLSQAIDGVLAQRADFAFELVIGVDLCDDESLEIARRYERRSPDVVRVLGAGEALGMHGNFQRLWASARAPLIAFCEGDDYWIYDRKLADQVALLDADPGATLCGAVAQIELMEPAGPRLAGKVGPWRRQTSYRFEDLVPGYTFHFSTALVRQDAVTFPGWFTETYCVDRPLYLLAAEHGHALCLDRVVSRYRQHDGGAWARINPSAKARQSTALFELMARHFDPAHRPLFERTLVGILWSYVGAAIQQGRSRSEVRDLFWRALRRGGLGSIRGQARQVAGMALRAYGLLPFRPTVAT